MRIIHTSDWHLGQELHEYARGAEHDAFLDWLLRQIQGASADALIMTGDLYDVANPTVEAQKRFYRFLREAQAQSPHLQIIVVGGNHDSAARVQLPKELLDADRVSLIGAIPHCDGKADLDGIIVPLRGKTGSVEVLCVAVPFLRPGDIANYGSEQDGVASLYAEVVKRATATNDNVPVIATGHLHVRGGAVSECSERPIFIGGSEAVSSEIFPRDLLYVALGHLHRPQVISESPLIRYAGSPFPMSLDERDYKHSIVQLDITDGRAQVSLIPVPRTVQFLRIPSIGASSLPEAEALLKELEFGDAPLESRPYLEVFVQLDGPEPDLRRRIEAALEGKSVRLTRITRQVTGGGGTLADGMKSTPDLNELKPEEVFRQLHKQEFSVDPTEVMMNSFKELVSYAADATATRAGGR